MINKDDGGLEFHETFQGNLKQVIIKATPPLLKSFNEMYLSIKFIPSKVYDSVTLVIFRDCATTLEYYSPQKESLY